MCIFVMCARDITHEYSTTFRLEKHNRQLSMAGRKHSDSNTTSKGCLTKKGIYI